MKKDRSDLRRHLRLLLLENCINKKVLTSVKNELLNVGILSGTVQDLFTQRIPTEQISEDVLYYLSKSLSRVLNKDVINPIDYFTHEEIEEIERTGFTNLSSEDETVPFTIKGVTQVSYDHWVVFMSARELVEKFYHRGRIRYRIETQRQPTIEKVGGVLIKTPTIVNKSIEEIKTRLLKGKFITNYITINSIKPDTFKYNPVTGELEVNDILDILDGFHRSMAMVRALSEGDINHITGINITNYDTQKALDFIEQEDHRNQMSRRFIKSLDKENKSNILIDMINRNEYSDLSGKIVTDRSLIRWGDALTLTDIMQKGVDRYFKLETMSQVKDVEKFLVEGFNHIIGLYPNYFIKNIKKGKKVSVMAHENMFLGYLYILNEIKNTENWKDELESILKNIDFSINNSKWKEIGLFNSEINKSTIDKIESYLGNFL